MQGISLLLDKLSNYFLKNVDNLLKFDLFVVIDLSYCIILFFIFTLSKQLRRYVVFSL